MRSWGNSYTEAEIEALASFPVIDAMNFDAYDTSSHTDDTLDGGAAGTAVVPTNLKLVLDFRPIRSTLSITLNAAPASVIEWGVTPSSATQVAVNFLTGEMEFHSGALTQAVVATYKHYGTVLDAHTFNRLQYAITELQSGGGGGGAVDSVNGQTGVVVLTHTDVGAAAASHNHDARYYTETETDGIINGFYDNAVTYTNTAVAGKANASHTHVIADTTGLQAALNDKAPIASPDFTGTIDFTGAYPLSYDPTTGVLTISSTDEPASINAGGLTISNHLISGTGDINFDHDGTGSFVFDSPVTATSFAGDGSALTGKANTVHTHAISDVTNLQTTLDGKAGLTSVNTFTQNASFGAGVTVVGTTGLTLKNTGASVGFNLIDRAATPGKQFVFSSNIAPNTAGGQAIVNYWQEAQTRAHTNNTAIVGGCCWATDPESESTCSQAAYSAIFQDNTGSATGKFRIVTHNYGSAPATIAKLPIEITADGTTGNPVIRIEQGAKLGFFNATPVVKPTVTLGNTDGEIAGLPISVGYDQAEIEMLRAKCEELADDVRNLKAALVSLGLIA